MSRRLHPELRLFNNRKIRRITTVGKAESPYVEIEFVDKRLPKLVIDSHNGLRVRAVRKEKVEEVKDVAYVLVNGRNGNGDVAGGSFTRDGYGLGRGALLSPQPAALQLVSKAGQGEPAQGVV